MGVLSRFFVAAVLVAGFGGVAQAQSNSRRVAAGQDGYYALYDHRDFGRGAEASGPVPPSVSGTVMGLRVPR